MENVWNYIDKGDLYRTEKQHRKAVSSYDEAIRVDPTLPVPHFYKHATYTDLANETIDSGQKAKYQELANESMSEYHRLLDDKRGK